MFDEFMTKAVVVKFSHAEVSELMIHSDLNTYRHFSEVDDRKRSDEAWRDLQRTPYGFLSQASSFVRKP